MSETVIVSTEDIARMALESVVGEGEEKAKRLAPTLRVAIGNMEEFLRGFPEIDEVYQGIALQTEIAHLLVGPFVSVHGIGWHAGRNATEEEAQ